MENVKVGFQISASGEKAPNGYQFVHCYMVFDIKMEDFRRKSHLVVEGNITQIADVITYFSVVTRETV